VERTKKQFCLSFLWIGALGLPPHSTETAAASPSAKWDSLHWSSGAELSRFPRALRGSLAISREGIDFRPAKGQLVHWTPQDTRTLELPTSRKLSLISYENRRGPIRGDRPFNFKLKNAVPAEVASELVRLVGKPAINGIPAPHAPSLETIGARHRTVMGGGSGVLRFRDDGIDYLASNGDDSRSWRWADIETLAHPEPYRLRIGGYLETFDLELKQRLPDDLLNGLWDQLYAQRLNTGAQRGNTYAESH
jgi:hypothetical protein